MGHFCGDTVSLGSDVTVARLTNILQTMNINCFDYQNVLFNDCDCVITKVSHITEL